ncbi:MAG: polyprenyl synthetase family protein [Holophagae bacterium]|jgi:geranylgeranyl pyrophosphate synthase
MDVTSLLADERREVVSALERLVPAHGIWPERLHRAMAHAVFAGGKRIRPILARLAHRAAGGDPDQITDAACGLELIHTYSLVHDDLPALDNDSLRRGQPTVHVAFDEATAILAGDALLTEGLLLISREPAGEAWAARRAEATAMVAEAISIRGMVGGQMEDMEATGQIIDGGTAANPEDRLELIHSHKTGCLLRASVELGAIFAGVDAAAQRSFVSFGEDLGLAFQIADDILDATASAAQLGKSPGKDEAAGKLTYVTLFGLDEARRRLAEVESRMVDEAAGLEGPNGELAALATFVCRRSN